MKTRKATKNDLVNNCLRTLKTMLEHGTTTIEAKSGYGLTTKDEIKCLEVIKILNKKQPINIIPTFLGAHAIPFEYREDVEEYVNLIVHEMIPIISQNKLAEFCDVFCENGVFNINQTKKILQKAKKCGLIAKLHADEFSSYGGAELAAEIGATSAAHLLFTSHKGIKALANKGVIAVLLPVAAFSLMKEKYANARKMIKASVPIAIGTDYNPSCWTENIQLAINFACYQMKMTTNEAISATTINAAHALKRGNIIGSLEVGKKGDVIILDIPNHKFLGYQMGVNLVDKVVKEGKLVVDQGTKIHD